MGNEEITNQASVGMLGWEPGKAKGLKQLEKLPGHSLNPNTYNFPLQYKRVPGANFDSIVLNPSAKVLKTMVETAQKLERNGIKALTTSCGFNAVFHSKLSNSVSIPVFASSLIQVPLVYRMLKDNQTVAIITARKSSLTNEHLTGVGVNETIPVVIEGIKENSKEWKKMEKEPEREIDVDRIENDVVNIAQNMVETTSRVGAFVLECTDLPPFSKSIREATDLPVFDLVTLVKMVYNTISRY